MLATILTSFPESDAPVPCLLSSGSWKVNCVQRIAAHAVFGLDFERIVAKAATGECGESVVKLPVLVFVGQGTDATIRKKDVAGMSVHWSKESVVLEDISMPNCPPPGRSFARCPRRE